MPGKEISSQAAYARLRASATDAAQPVTLRIRPPFVTRLPSYTAVPAWKTSAPVSSASVVPAEDRLRLRIAEAAVELEHLGPVVGEHEPGVERPDERSAAARELGQDGAVHGVDDLVGVDGHRRIRAHAAGVRSGVGLTDP